jgi:hypothetical protein
MAVHAKTFYFFGDSLFWFVAFCMSVHAHAIHLSAHVLKKVLRKGSALQVRIVGRLCHFAVMSAKCGLKVYCTDDLVGLFQSVAQSSNFCRNFCA